MIDIKQEGQIGFAIKMIRETVAYPYILIKEYGRMGIEEHDFVILLRILHPYFSKGDLNVEDVANEFGVSTDEAKVIIMPFLEKGLLRENKRTSSIDCSGVFNCYYEEWLSTQRVPGKKIAESKSVRMPEKDRQLIRELAHIYRVFEQEMGRHLTPIQSEEIRNWLEKDGLTAEMVEEALRRSVIQEKRTFAYIKSILRKWREAGYTSLQDIMENDHKTQPAATEKKQGVKSKKGKYSEIYEKY